eukprot:1154907-Pelagomonas_calceolata.AAC.2
MWHDSMHTFAHQHQLTHCPHAYLWLFKMFIIPAGMCACQVQTTPYLQQDHEVDNWIQKWLLRFLKSISAIRSSNPSWSVLRECVIEPFQFKQFRATVRLYSPLIHCNSPLLQKDFHADTSLSSRNPSCWTSHVLFAMHGLRHAHGFQQKVRSANPLDLSQLVMDLRSEILLAGDNSI